MSSELIKNHVMTRLWKFLDMLSTLLDVAFFFSFPPSALLFILKKVAG